MEQQQRMKSMNAGRLSILVISLATLAFAAFEYHSSHLSSNNLDVKSNSSQNSIVLQSSDSKSITASKTCDGSSTTPRGKGFSLLKWRRGRSSSSSGGGQGLLEMGDRRGGSSEEARTKEPSAIVAIDRKRRRRLLTPVKDAVKKVVGTTTKIVKKLFRGVGRLLGIKKGNKENDPASQPRPSSATLISMDKLSPEHRIMVEDCYQELLAIPGLVERGQAVKMTIDRDCVARYYIAAQWKTKGGKSMAENVLNTVKWREDQRLVNIPLSEILDQASNGYLYVNGTDSSLRPVIYYRPAYQNNEDPATTIRYLIYTLERALDEARRSQAQAYSFIIDCSGFSLSNIPPVAIIKQVFTLLHHHYPTRVGFILFLNTGTAFQLLWKVLQPLVSPMTRQKISFVPTGQETKEMLSRIPAEELEVGYGGGRLFTWSAASYFGLPPTEKQ